SSVESFTFAQTYITAVARRIVFLTKIIHEPLPATCMRFAIVCHLLQFCEQDSCLGRVIFNLAERAELYQITSTKKQYHITLNPVTSGTTCFLIIAFDVFG